MVVLLAAVLTLPAVRASAAETKLIEGFEGKFDLAKVKTADAAVKLVRGATSTALRIDTGHKHDWPGVTLRPPGDKWDLSAWASLRIDVRNVGDSDVTLCCRVDNPGADGRKNCNTFTITLAPGKSGVLRGDFVRRNPSGVKLFGMRGYPRGANTGDPRAIDTRNITQLLIFVPRPKKKHSLVIDNIAAVDPYPPADHAEKLKRFLPMIDEFGQYIHKDWPGKTRSKKDFAARLAEEAKDLAAHPGPQKWNTYGGWSAGPKLKATGFFRTEKYHGKWWLVDPEGRLFWSHGIDCVRPRVYTPITDRDSYFRSLPDGKSAFSQFYGRGSWAPHGYYRDRGPYRMYDFGRANLLRKYGQNWAQRHAAVAHARLRSWGMNTIANWSDPQIYLRRKTPYTLPVYYRSPRIRGSKGYWGKFPDVFDPAFATALAAAFARQKDKTASDKWCIGYFVNNELGWGNDVSLAIAALASPPDQPAKKAFIADLKAKYSTIAALNTAWGTKHKSWEHLSANRGAPDRTRARADLRTFYTKTAETYFRTIRRELKKVAPNHLYLGCRFAWVNDLAARAAAKYCDVICYNRYKYAVEDLRLPGNIDRPIVIGEFHFGALDRGMFHTGLRKARHQKHRGELYAAYVRGALRNPLIVGTHWFQYKDQATTGRGDGENYQIGFVDICDSPYPETIEACRTVGYTMYEYRLRATASAN